MRRAQALIEDYFLTHGQATSTELLRLLNEHFAGCEYRKVICRLRQKKKMDIRNIAPVGTVAHYVFNRQPSLF